MCMHDRVHKTCIHDAFCSCHTAKNKIGDGRWDPKQFYVFWRIEAVNLIISASGDSRTALRFAVKDTLLDIVPHTIDEEQALLSQVSPCPLLQPFFFWKRKIYKRVN